MRVANTDFLNREIGIDCQCSRRVSITGSPIDGAEKTVVSASSVSSFDVSPGWGRRGGGFRLDELGGGHLPIIGGAAFDLPLGMDGGEDDLPKGIGGGANDLPVGIGGGAFPPGTGGEADLPDTIIGGAADLPTIFIGGGHVFPFGNGGAGGTALRNGRGGGAALGLTVGVRELDAPILKNACIMTRARSLMIDCVSKATAILCTSVCSTPASSVSLAKWLVSTLMRSRTGFGPSRSASPHTAR